MIKTAAEHIADMRREQDNAAHRRRYAEINPTRDERMAMGEALRDDVMSHWRNSGMTLDRLHEISGVSTVTLSNWANRETKFPQMATAQAILKALGKRLTVATLH